MATEQELKEHRVFTSAFEKFLPLRNRFSVKKWIYSPAHYHTMHNHDYPQLWYCLSGRYMHCVDGKTYECKKGSVVLVPPGLFHKFWIPEGNVVEILNLDVNYDFFQDAPLDRYVNAVANLFLQPFKKELGFSTPLYYALCPESQKAIEEAISWFASVTIIGADKIPMETLRAKLEEIFSLPEFVLSEEQQKKAVRVGQMRLGPIVRALTYMNLHYAEIIKEEDLLQVTASCRTDFYQYFKRFTGYSWLIYQQWLKARHVFIYLTFTTYTLSYVSDICGFYDASHMSRVFKKCIGMTPRAFQAKQKQWLKMHPQSKMYLTDF